MKHPLLFIVLIALSGCATYHVRPIAPAALMNAFEARTLDSPDLREYVAAHCDESGSCTPGVWDLNTLTLAAFYFSPALDIARAKHGVSQAAIQSAGQRPNPALQLPFAYTTNAKIGESPYTFGLGLDIPLETASKRGYRLAQAQQMSNAARFNIGNIAWQVRSRLRGHMLNFYAATRRIEILEQQITAQQQIVAMLNKRLAVGAASLPDADQARIALARNRIDLAHAQQQSQDERAQIASAIGLPVDALANIQIVLPPLSGSIPLSPPMTPAVRRFSTAPTYWLRYRNMRPAKRRCNWKSPASILTFISGPGTLLMRGRTNSCCRFPASACPFSIRIKGRLPKPAHAARKRPRASTRCKRKPSMTHSGQYKITVACWKIYISPNRCCQPSGVNCKTCKRPIRPGRRTVWR